MDELDFSKGNPLLPMTSVARYAFRKAAADLNEYSLIFKNEAYQPVGQILEGISAYFQQRGIRHATSDMSDTKGVLVLGGGTTEGFDMVMAHLAREIRARRQRGKAIIPLILTPTPTYGYFTSNAREYHDIQVVPVPLDSANGWRLNLDDLQDIIDETLLHDQRIVAYYDSNPHNPTGRIRTHEETAAIAHIFQKLNNIYQEKDRDNAPTRAYQVPVDELDVFANRVALIDDMVYDGLEYAGSPKPFGFAQLDEPGLENVYQDTFTLFGTSKAGLVNMRAGVLVAPKKTLQPILYNQLTRSYFPPKVAFHACGAYFSTDKKLARQRQKHLDTLNHEHQRRGLLMKALVNGMDNMPELTAPQRGDLINMVMTGKNCTQPEAEKLLGGMPYLKITTTPQAGFFHMLDWSGMEGLVYEQLALVPEKYRADYDSDRFDDLSCDSAFQSSLQLCINMVGSHWMDMGTRLPTARVTFAKPIAEILEFTDRLRMLAEAAKNPAPKPAAEKHPDAALKPQRANANVLVIQ